MCTWTGSDPIEGPTTTRFSFISIFLLQRNFSLIVIYLLKKLFSRFTFKTFHIFDCNFFSHLPELSSKFEPLLFLVFKLLLSR